MRVGLGLPDIALLYRPCVGEMTGMVEREVLGRLVVIDIRGVLGLLQPGGHLVIHILWF